MALASMTGFSRQSGQYDAHRWVWEISGVNSKGLDIRLRFPQGAEGLEIAARRLVTDRLSRGSVSVFLAVDARDTDLPCQVNEPLVRQILDLAARWQDLGIDKPRLDGLLALKGVLVPPTGLVLSDAQRDQLEAAQMETLDQALGAFVQARREEGARLGHILCDHLDRLDALILEGEAADALRPDKVRARLVRQLDDLMGASGTQRLSEDRLYQELALLAVKADVREELDRLRSHLQGARELLHRGGPCGRQLDFLSQELNREANTLCSKSQDVSLTRIGMEIKSTINQFREQILNLE